MSILVLPSLVHAVTVYRSGALVTRRAALARADGAFPRRVRLTDLPLALDDGSVRARVLTPDGAVAGVAATEVHVGVDAPAIEPASRPPEVEELEAAKLDEERLRGLLAQLEVEFAALAALAVAPRPRGPQGGPPVALPTKPRLELISLHARETARLAERKLELDKQLEDAQERRADLEARRARATTARPAREDEVRKTVLIALADGGGDAECVLDVQYLVPGARWAPAYALELSADHRQARLSLRAMVAQASGEDWPGARLTFSTALPQAWTELPELTSLRIGRRQALGGRRGWVPPPTGAEELYDDYNQVARRIAARSGAAISMDVETTLTGVVVPQAQAPAPDRKRKMARPKAAPGGRTMAPQPAAPMPAMAESPVSVVDGVARAASALFSGDSGTRNRLDRLGSFSGHEAEACAEMSFAAGAPADEHAPAEPPPVTVGSDLLDHGRLRMRGLRRGCLGRLERASDGEVYQELIAALRVNVRIDVSVIHRAQERAESVVSIGLPPRYEPPSAAGGFDYAYPAEFPLDVPSDGSWHAVVLGAREGVAELTHVCVPRESSDVFRLVSLVNPLDAPLLDGPVDVMVAGEFRMTAPLHQVPPRGKLVLGLGTEPAIKVARNTSFREETTGMMGGSLALEHEIKIEAISHLPGRTQLEVRERVPVVREGDDQAKVVLRDVAPPWLPFEQADPPLKGGHVWRLSLDQGKRETLRARYGIEISAKNELVGGNRREA